MLQYNGYNIRVIENKDNQQVCAVIKEVFYELGLPLVGTAYADKDTLSMYEAYQDLRSVYYVVEKEASIYGGCGIKQLNGTNENICELQKFYFHKSLRGKGIGDKIIELCLDFAIKSNFKKCYLETMPNMINAQKLYLRKGFDYIDEPLGNTGHTACPLWMIKTLV